MSTQTTTPADGGAGGRRIEGWHALVGIVCFFAVIIGVNFVMAYFAITTHSGVDTADAYRKGLAYNTRIAAEARQEALGWRETVEWTGIGAPLRLTLASRAGEPVTGLHVTALVGRPATDRYDHTVVMTERAPGTYEVRVSQAVPGNWAVEISAARVKATGHDPIYETRRRVWLKQ